MRISRVDKRRGARSKSFETPMIEGNEGRGGGETKRSSADRAWEEQEMAWLSTRVMARRDSEVVNVWIWRSYLILFSGVIEIRGHGTHRAGKFKLSCLPREREASASPGRTTRIGRVWLVRRSLARFIRLFRRPPFHGLVTTVHGYRPETS